VTPSHGVLFLVKLVYPLRRVEVSAEGGLGVACFDLCGRWHCVTLVCNAIVVWSRAYLTSQVLAPVLMYKQGRENMCHSL
jgi:hypothetical protein